MCPSDAVKTRAFLLYHGYTCCTWYHSQSPWDRRRCAESTRGSCHRPVLSRECSGILCVSRRRRTERANARSRGYGTHVWQGHEGAPVPAPAPVPGL